MAVRATGADGAVVELSFGRLLQLAREYRARIEALAGESRRPVAVMLHKGWEQARDGPLCLARRGPLCLARLVTSFLALAFNQLSSMPPAFGALRPYFGVFEHVFEPCACSARVLTPRFGLAFWLCHRRWR